MFQQILQQRNLPELLSRDEMMRILQEQEYGYLPEKPTSLHWQVQENLVKNFCAGKAVLHKITLTCELGEKSFSFPVHLCLPTAQGKHPFFIRISFGNGAPDAFVPTEELIDHGFVCDQFPADIGDEFFEGDIGYHLRNGPHYFGREDWLKQIKFVKKHYHN